MECNLRAFILFFLQSIFFVLPSSGAQPIVDLEAHQKTIDEIYANITGFHVRNEEYKMIEKKGGNATYGEIKYDSLQCILEDLNLTWDDVFYDLGSGVGKVVMQTYLNTPVKKSVGIELSPTRHQRAMKAYTLLAQRTTLQENKTLQLLEKNILDVDLSDATVVYMCSTCYPKPLMQKLVEILSKLKKGLRVITFKTLPEYQKYGFKLINEYTLPMTWSRSTHVYVYQL